MASTGIGGIINRLKKKLTDEEGYFQKGQFTPVKGLQMDFRRAAADPINRKTFNVVKNSPVVKPAIQTYQQAMSFADPRKSYTPKQFASAYSKPVFSGARTALEATALGRLSAPTLGFFGGIGAGMGYLQSPKGKKIEGMVSQTGKSLASAPSIMGVAQFTNPLIARGATAVGAKLARPASKFIGERVATALGNIPEGYAMAKQMGVPYGKEQLAIDVGAGLVMGKPTIPMKAKGKIPIRKLGQDSGILYPDDIQEIFKMQMRRLQKWQGPDGKINIKQKTADDEMIEGMFRAYVGKLPKKIKISVDDMLDELYKKASLDYQRPDIMTSNLVGKSGGKIKVSPKEARISQSGMQSGIEQPSSTLEFSSRLKQPKPIPVSQTARTSYRTLQSDQGSTSLDNIISQGHKQIQQGESSIKKQSIRESMSDLYTQWVSRYNPIEKASQKVKVQLKKQGAELRPEYDPEYLVRRLTGAGGIADHRFNKELKPIIDQLDNLNINKLDMDTYLANKRIVGFGKAGRDIYGADPKKAQKIVMALETKYGDNIKQLADGLYKYQDKGLQELADAGFFTKEQIKAMKSQNPDYSPLFRVMDEVNDYLGLPTRKTMQASSPVVRIKGSTKQIESPIESITKNTFTQRAAIEKNRVAQSLTNLQNIMDLGFKKVSKSGPDTITVWNNGKKEYWNVGKDIADVAKGLNEENMNLVLKMLQQPAGILRQGATGRNPEFMIPNIIRDQFEAGVTSKYGYVPFIDYVSGLKSMLKNDDIFQKWQQSGARIDLGELAGRKSIQQHFNDKEVKKGLFTWLREGLDVMGKYSEQPTRVGLFKKAYRKTGNEMLAMMESRDATVDFARMGSKMKVANSIIPFLNVNLQGFDKLIRSIKANPSKVLLKATIYGAIPSATTTTYNLLYHPEEYAEIPEYEKENNFVIVTGRNEKGTVDYITIPKGHVVPIITNPIESFIRYISGHNEQTFKEFALQLFSSALPVVGEGGSLKEIGIKTIGGNLPQAIKPITENLINKSFYKYDPKKEQARDIVPTYLQKKEPYQQAYDFTPEMYKKIGAVFNVSPLQVKNLMEGYLAGYSKIPAQMIEMLKSVSRGEPIDPNEKTLLRRFLKQTYEGSAKKSDEPKERTPFMQRVMGGVSASGEVEEMKIPDNLDDLKVIYNDAKNVVEKYKEKKTKIDYDPTLTKKEKEDKIEKLQKEFDSIYPLVKKIEQEKPEELMTLSIDIFKSGGGKTTQERAKWVSTELEKIKTEEDLEKVLNKLYNGNVLTKSVVEELEDEYGIVLDEYIEGGKRKTRFGSRKSSKGRKAKKLKVPELAKMGKISVSKARTTPVKIGKATTLPSIKIKASTGRKITPFNIRSARKSISDKGEYRIKRIVTKKPRVKIG